MKRVYYEDRPMVQATIERALTERKDYCIKYRINRLSGAPLPIICKAKMYFRQDGTLDKIVGIIRKIEDGAA